MQFFYLQSPLRLKENSITFEYNFNNIRNVIQKRYYIKICKDCHDSTIIKRIQVQRASKHEKGYQINLSRFGGSGGGGLYPSLGFQIYLSDWDFSQIYFADILPLLVLQKNGNTIYIVQVSWQLKTFFVFGIFKCLAKLFYLISKLIICFYIKVLMTISAYNLALK